MFVIKVTKQDKSEYVSTLDLSQVLKTRSIDIKTTPDKSKALMIEGTNYARLLVESLQSINKDVVFKLEELNVKEL